MKNKQLNFINLQKYKYILLKVNDTLTIIDDNEHKKSFFIKEFQSYNSSKKKYPVKINAKYPNTNNATLSARIDYDLIRLYNGYGIPKFNVDRSGNVGIGVSLDNQNEYPININSTSAIKLPSGKTSERPSSLTSGLIRYNTNESTIEFYKTNSI